MDTESSRLEEYVSRLVSEYCYPARSLRRDVLYPFGRARYRLDILVTKEGRPYIVIEIKTKSLEMASDQLVSYVRATGANFAVASDGYTDRCYKVVRDTYETRLKLIPDIPSFGKTLEDIGKHSNSALVRISRGHLHGTILSVVDVIHSKQFLSREEAFKEVLRLLLLKVFDETKKDAMFRALVGESAENIKSRIIALSMQASDRYSAIPFLKDPSKLSTETIAMIVYNFQKYSIHDSVKDIAGSKLPAEEILGPRAYEYFTPGILAKFMIDLLQLKKGSTFLDSACGFGSLLVEAASRGAIVTGFDINSDIVQYAKVNLALAGLSGKIMAQDSLRIPEGFDEVVNSNVGKIGFDYAAVVPPFGGRIEDERLNSFDLGLKKKSQTTEVLFFESTLRLLREGGKMAIVLPESFLFADSAYDAREFMLRKSKIIAIISLPNRVLSPNLAFNSSLVVLQSSPSRGTTEQDPVFVAIVEDEKEFDSLAYQLGAFQEQETVPAERDVFITHLTSAKQINADYLRASISMELIDSRLAGRKGSDNVELQEIADLTTGARLEDIGQEDQEGDVFYIRGGNVGDLSLEVNDNDRVRARVDISRWSAQPGDILMTRAGTVGRVAMVMGDCLPVVIGSNIIRIRLSDKNRVLPEYLLAYLGSERGQAQISMYTGGSVIRAASISGLKRVRIPIPSMERQLKVATQVGRLLEAKRDAMEVLSKMRMKEEKIRKELEKSVLGVEN